MSEDILPSLEEIKKFDTDNLIKFLKKQTLNLHDNHFNIIRNEEIDGEVFIDSTKEELRNYGMKGGTAKKIAKFIGRLKEVNEEFDEKLQEIEDDSIEIVSESYLRIKDKIKFEKFIKTIPKDQNSVKYIEFKVEC
ncbi:1185_t:CDS:2 [Funneliformis caledonium]|uniref:1185_t:CDS:1 n=1 Tax=Funneliformis caledonium TaxID=1117310 RepID=A0A9N8ZU38_9GLOM|nr:1185_t:CDS:2 [Funneliformis caledonium]